MKLEIVQVSVGVPVSITGHGNGDLWSSILRKKADGPEVEVTLEGIAGNEQANKRVHGGPDKAIYVLPHPHLAEWSGLAGFELKPGGMGENLTIRGATEKQVRIGDRFACGNLVVEVSKSRQPCVTLEGYLGIPAIALMKENCLSGWYFRIVTPGLLPVDGTLELLSTTLSQPTVEEHFCTKMNRTP